MTKYYSQLIADIFTKGDARYSEEYNEFAIYFLKNNAVTVEAKEVSHLINNIPLPNEVLEIEGPQQLLKRLALSIFQEFGVELIGFERNVGYGRVDILGRLRDKRMRAVICPERSESAAWRGAERSEHRRVNLEFVDGGNFLNFHFIKIVDYLIF